MYDKMDGKIQVKGIIAFVIAPLQGCCHLQQDAHSMKQQRLHCSFQTVRCFGAGVSRSNQQLVPKLRAGQSESSPAKSVCCDVRDKLSRQCKIRTIYDGESLSLIKSNDSRSPFFEKFFQSVSTEIALM